MKICNRIKKKFRRKLAAILVAGMMAFSVGTTSVNAADVINITLDETIQRAFENNRNIKESVAEREQAYWSLSEARRQANPQISWSLNAQRFGGDAYRDYTYHNAFSHTAAINIPIYQGGRLKEGRKYARWGLSNADLSLEDTMQTVRLQSTIYYFNVLQYRNLIEVYEEEVVTLQEHLRNVNAQFRVGTVAKVDVLESQVELANAQQNLVNIQNQYDVAVAELNNYIGLPADTIIRPQDTLTYKKYNLDLGDCTAYALENRADAAMADYAVKQAESNKRSAKAGWRPSVSGSVSKGFTHEHLFSGKLSDQWAAGISASWNIFDSGVTRAQVESAKVEVDRLKLAMNADLDSVHNDVVAAHKNLRIALLRLTTTQRAVELAEEERFIATERYNVGEGILLDILDAENALVTAKKNNVSARYDVIRYSFDLAHAAGNTLKALAVANADIERGEQLITSTS